MKVRVDRHNCFYYPDLLVTCDSRDQGTDYYKCFPKLIIEVLSESTELRDRGEKFFNYSALESLEEYVLISQDKMRVECFRRDDNNRWVLEWYGPGDRVFFHSIPWQGAINDLYEAVPLLG
jgi:Uma2 family endonuclease